MAYTEVGPNFNPEVGFWTRRGYRRISPSVFTTFRPADFWGLHEVRPHVFHNTIWNYETGEHETQFTHIDNHLEWRNGHEIHTGMNITREGVFTPFEIYPGVIVPPGTYDNSEAQIVGNTNPGAPFSVNFRFIAGGFFNGDRVQLGPDFAWRINEAFKYQRRVAAERHRPRYR